MRRSSSSIRLPDRLADGVEVPLFVNASSCPSAGIGGDATRGTSGRRLPSSTPTSLVPGPLMTPRRPEPVPDTRTPAASRSVSPLLSRGAAGANSREALQQAVARGAGR